ncbi:soluble scavenger receptor cysteine-rich domain-containing protein SSC5D-like [Xyrauchen texanus]|uniref:soluble scavenger receptor cysteine-rich domain-containing protein SSC5D-like n=1 Tax=Xyrauchen texanus TaxID=154827 RepID=UPI0022426F98|nr:soluble scavenger receptor cysteine-rich domain-containing protein SSC5D-like [Xyrauchen texanus]
MLLEMSVLDNTISTNANSVKLVDGFNSCSGRVEVFHDAKTKLVDGFNTCSGRVEVYHSWWWGTVCDNGWDVSDAAVVCREMGCGDVIEAKTGAYFGKGSGSIWMADVNCVGNESTLSACESRKWGVTDCDHSKDAGVICQPTVRLVDGSNSCSGRVEVFYAGEWGTVCDDSWDWNEAAVSCREMGCGDVIEAKTGAYFGQGTGRVWLSGLQCYSSESSLRSCKSIGWGQNSCEHQKDAGVACQREYKTFFSNVLGDLQLNFYAFVAFH